MSVVVDAGNGAGGFFAHDVLAPLGADVSDSQFLEPDGSFPNHVPNPEDAEAMGSCATAVLKANADLGVVLDTDCDRSGLVLSDGRFLNRNRLIAALCASVLRDSPGASIVTDSVTSAGLADFIEGRGGVHVRFQRGYKNVINKGVELNEQVRRGATLQNGVEPHLHRMCRLALDLHFAQLNARSLWRKDRVVALTSCQTDNGG